MTEINNENNIIIARQQQRRGFKQDIPQPLRPGEIGSRLIVNSFLLVQMIDIRF